MPNCTFILNIYMYYYCSDNHGEKRKQELKSQGFSIISGRAVKYFSTSKSWDSARAACHGMKGFLLTVDSNTMTNWAKQHGSFWIGLNDKVNVTTLLCHVPRYHDYRYRVPTSKLFFFLRHVVGSYHDRCLISRID